MLYQLPRLPGLKVTLLPGPDLDDPARGAVAQLSIPLDRLGDRHEEIRTAARGPGVSSFRDLVMEQLGVDRVCGDLGRAVEAAMAAAAHVGGLDALEWLGIPWEEGQLRERLQEHVVTPEEAKITRFERLLAKMTPERKARLIDALDERLTRLLSGGDAEA